MRRPPDATAVYACCTQGPRPFTLGSVSIGSETISTVAPGPFGVSSTSSTSFGRPVADPAASVALAGGAVGGEAAGSPSARKTDETPIVVRVDTGLLPVTSSA